MTVRTPESLCPKDRLVPDAGNARGAIDLTSADNRELKASIDLHGILCPLLVSPRPDGLFDLVDGHRRYFVGSAAGVTDYPFRELPASLTPTDRSIVQLVANLQSSDVPDLDLATKLSVLLDAQKWTQKHLAKLLGKSEATVTRLLQLDRLAEPVKEMVRAGRLPATAAATLAQLPDTDQVVLAGELAAGTLTRTGLARAVRAKQSGRAGRKPAAPTRAFRFGTGRGEEVVVKAAADLTPATLIERLRRVIAAAERADRQGLGVRVVSDLLKASIQTVKESS